VVEKSPIALKFALAGAADGPERENHVNGKGLDDLNREYAFDDIRSGVWSGFPEGPGMKKCTRESEMAIYWPEKYDAEHLPIPPYLYWSTQSQGNQASSWESWYEIGHHVTERRRWITFVFRLYIVNADFGGGVWKLEETGVDGPFKALDLKARNMPLVSAPPSDWPGNWSSVAVKVSGYRP
jgi:hypothetical protein